MGLCALGRENTGMISNVNNQWTHWLDSVSNFLVFSRNCHVPLAPDCGSRVPQELSAMLLCLHLITPPMWCGCLSSCCHPLFMSMLLPLWGWGKQCCLENVDQVFVLLPGRYPELDFLICHVPQLTGLSLPVKYFCIKLKKPFIQLFFSSKCSCFCCCSLFAWWLCCKRRALHI